jgi:hypothetical protein
MNVLDKPMIAKGVANDIVDHLLAEEPITAPELESLAIDITEECVNSNDVLDIADIVAYVVNYLSSDPRVTVTPEDAPDNPLLWFSRKSI